MIRISVQSQDILAINKAIADAVNTLRAKSYAGRNPSLGRMIKCAVCGNRHYSSKACEPRYATHDRHGDPYFEDGSPLVINVEDIDNPIVERHQRQIQRAIFGVAAFAKKRLNPHLHPRVNEILHRANEGFNEETKTNESFGLNHYQPDVTEHVRAAKNIVLERRDRKSRKAQKQADISRRINRGLALPGSRA